jgi:outer membrane protein TolC
MKFFLTWLTLGMAAAVARAEVFTPEQAVARALSHNPTFAAQRAQAEAARWREKAVSAQALPNLNLAAGALRSNNPLTAFGGKLNTRSVTSADFEPSLLNNPGTTNLYSGAVELRYPLYAGGRLDAQSDSARSHAQARALSVERAREELAYVTLKAYLDLQQAIDAAAIVQTARSAAAGHAATTAALVRDGRTVASDKLTADVNRTAYDSASAKAEAQVQHARVQLRLLMNLPNETTLEVLPATAAALPGELENLSAATEPDALNQRRDLAAAKAAWASAAARVKAARGGHRPTLDVVASRQYFDNGDANSNSTNLLGVLNVELYGGGRVSAEIEAAAADALEAELQAKALEEAVRSQVRHAQALQREAFERQKWAQGNVERAQENVRQIKNRYGQGRTILIDLLQAERALVDARLEESAARYAWQDSRYALDLARGALVPPTGDKP